MQTEVMYSNIEKYEFFKRFQYFAISLSQFSDAIGRQKFSVTDVLNKRHRDLKKQSRSRKSFDS